MAKKIYLSPAAHAADNPTKCKDKCGENVHANQYMDMVERRLKSLGFEVKRGDKKLTGSKAMTTRVREANAWKADIYYVAHTNAGGGRYSVTYSYPDEPSKAKAAVIGKYRKALEAHNGYKWRQKTAGDLYEINATSMVCLYDELFFHDNAEDCAWFHDGGMEKMAEETVQAFCELCGVAYKSAEVPAVATPVTPPPTAVTAGMKITLDNGRLYVASTGDAGVTRTGVFYIYDGQKINGRYRVTNTPARVNKSPIAGNVSGWVEL